MVMDIRRIAVVLLPLHLRHRGRQMAGKYPHFQRAGGEGMRALGRMIEKLLGELLHSRAQTIFGEQYRVGAVVAVVGGSLLLPLPLLLLLLLLVAADAALVVILQLVPPPQLLPRNPLDQ